MYTKISVFRTVGFNVLSDSKQQPNTNKKETICELGMCLSTLPVHTEPWIQPPAPNNPNMVCHGYHTLTFGKLRQEDQKFIMTYAHITKHG